MNKIKVTMLLGALMLGVPLQALAADATTLLVGDIVTGLSPFASFGVAYFKDDTEGEKQWARTMAINEIVNTGARLAFNNTSWGRRPDGSQYGFPSGHAGFLFAQAAFLQERYGWKYGMPAFLVASGVSYIRVREDKHRWRDVIAGGGLAYGVSFLTVTPLGAMHLAPVVGPDWIGIRFQRSF
jgi:membrane-associated phospholipid phosphatase